MGTGDVGCLGAWGGGGGAGGHVDEEVVVAEALVAPGSARSFPSLALVIIISCRVTYVCTLSHCMQFSLSPSGKKARIQRR